MAAELDRATVTWATPECPFSIECSSRVLDDIRLTATDAFFSLPRGGAEIGGILLGVWQEGLLMISECVPLECEHAMGPSFTLSLRDEARLQELILAAARSGAGVPAGWYHSHTRTGVNLSDSDLTIHNRFFPETWQVALVVKPHTLEPMRAGFFFRGNGGIIHTSSSYREFVIQPMPMRQVPKASAAPKEPVAEPMFKTAAPGPIVDVRPEPTPRPAAVVAPAPVIEVRAEFEPVPPKAPVVEVLSEPAPAPVVEVKPQPEPARAPASPMVEIRSERPPQPAAVSRAVMPAPVPEPVKFSAVPPRPPAERAAGQKPNRPWLWPAVAMAIGVVLLVAIAAYLERNSWLSHQAPPPPAPAASAGLNTVDQAGQLQIRWDANSPAVRAASGASLEITDGPLPLNLIRLDAQHLASGVFTYGRRNERVDVTLTLDQPDGNKTREVTSFLGAKPPAPAAPPKSPPPAAPANALSNHEREEMSRTIAGLREQLDAEIERGRRIQKQLDTARAQLREQQLRRLGNQARPPEQ